MTAGERRLVVVSGLSGAGKTVALHALEDQGFYCVDNLPLALLGEFVRLLEAGHAGGDRHVALGVDARNPADELTRFAESLGADEARGRMELVFIEASDAALLKRFSETRRRHPLSGGGRSLIEAIRTERGLLAPLAERANMRIDTTSRSVHELRQLVRARIARSPREALSLQLVSFGYKFGLPLEADFVFDVRCLPNPHWEARLRDLTGLDAPVAEFLASAPAVGNMIEQLAGLLAGWLPAFERENRSYLTVAVGCTGGRHRSVYLVEQLASRLRGWGREVTVTHRELG